MLDMLGDLTMLARFLCGQILVAPNVITHHWKEEIEGSNMRDYLDQESCIKSDYKALKCVFGLAKLLAFP
jgi:hypothetical protein